MAKQCDLLFQEDPIRIFDALEIFEPDLIILDLNLPRLSGFDLIKLLQEDPAFEKIPIMVFSQHHDVESQKLAYRLGAQHFLAKPCRPSQLFKGAVLFARMAIKVGREPVKRYVMKQVKRRLAEQIDHCEAHSTLRHAAAVHERRSQFDPDRVAGRSIMASVAGGWPVSD
jgi:CheY-like chemotaxis protein